MAKDIICPFCQQPTSPDAKFCGNCGRQLSSPVANATNPSPNTPAGTSIAGQNPAIIAPTNPQTNATTAVPNTAANSPGAVPAVTTSATPAQTHNLPPAPMPTPPTTSPPTVVKDKFFRLPRLARPISVALIIIFSLFTLIFAQPIFRNEEYFEDQQPTEGQTREQFIGTMRIFGVVFTSISVAIVAFGIACYKHPRPKKITK